MFEQIHAIFPQAVLLSQSNDDWDRYHWFKATEQEIIGIPKSTITKKEYELLNTFLTPFVEQHPILTTREKLWQGWILGNEYPDENTLFPSSFRFVYFSLTNQEIDQDVFREAIQGLFPHQMPIIWNNQHEGIIIEEQFQKEREYIEYEQMIDVLMSDFYTKLTLYITPYYHSKNDIRHAYSWGETLFKKMLRYHPKPVVTYQDAITYMYLDSLSQEHAANITYTLLQPVIEDSDLLHTIQVFLESNSNTTLAAKNLYMHRNSLQYRVDKFIEKTGIDVKQFQGALITYLAILNLQHKD